jgi:uncharacterized protein
LPTDWTDLARVGGFPTPAIGLGDAEARALWFAGYTQTYLERDLRDLAAVHSLIDFRRLMAALCLRIGNVLNVTEVARDVSQAQATVHRHLDLLELSFQLVRLPAYAVNRTKRLVKSPKLYGADVGLAMYLAAESAPRGAHLENLLVAELRAWQATQPARPSLMYWRTTGGLEVDLVGVPAGDQTPAALFLPSARSYGTRPTNRRGRGPIQPTAGEYTHRSVSQRIRAQ